MPVSQTELKTALQALLNTVKFRIRNRYGIASQLDLASMKAGEIAMATDTQEVYACFGNGIFRNLARGITIKGVYADLTALQTAHPTGAESDIYAAGSAPQHLYIWQNSAWADMGAWNDITMYATAGGLAATDAKVNAVNLIGEIKIWATNTAPTKYIFADGSLVSRTTYAALFAVIGTTFGAGDGSTTFALPDLKGRVPVGYSSGDSDFGTLGAKKGEKTHILTGPETPVINTLFHGAATGGTTSGYVTTFSGTCPNTPNEIQLNSAGGGAHNNIQPSIVLRYIIRALA